ncbi:unnamed protein product [Spirodela intermedia]|uniref:PIG-P domain-containing protein n=1 Tax=Spirodela intermedia TaxID=51605 RepID=A0A7I8JDD5_SPIIN|nr:unnamed protein product [Spirodela intermedia]CAA6668174.1 unnamed protein product [Spirodela intermedia]
MEDSPSSFTVSSPRRTLSLLKRERRAAAWPLPDQERKGAGAGAPVGPKPSEVYGFVGAISTVIATGELIKMKQRIVQILIRFLVWAYTPEPWLHALGITYYPSKFWALAVPAYAIVANILAMAFYLGLNFASTPPPTSFATLFDEHTREPSALVASEDGVEKPIEPISDLSIAEVNDLMFGNIS